MSARGWWAKQAGSEEVIDGAPTACSGTGIGMCAAIVRHGAAEDRVARGAVVVK